MRRKIWSFFYNTFNMPKTIALCYSGEPRNILQTLENHRANLWRDHTVHIYLHTWKDASTATPNEIGYCNLWREQIPNVPSSSYIERMKPYRYIIQPRTMVPQTWQQRQVSMYQGIHACLDLVDPTVPYDYILRVRPDVWFLNPIDLPETAEPNDIFLLPNAPVVEGFEWDPTILNVSDFFAICTPQSIKTYRSFQFSLTDTMIPTEQLGAHLKTHGTVHKIPVYIHLYRNLVWRNFQATG